MHTLAAVELVLLFAAGVLVGLITGVVAGAYFLTWSLEREWQRALRQYDARRATTTAYEFINERRERFRNPLGGRSST